MDPDIARNVTAERVRRVAKGYTSAKENVVAGLGGGFQFCTLSREPLFTSEGQIRPDVTFPQLAEFVWFIETGSGKVPEGDWALATPRNSIRRCWASSRDAPSTCSTTASSRTTRWRAAMC
ncbi:MAG: hypothetical protein IPI44_15720 [Sulfuritalea sp.]|nr:hypothetical protein [Sulfuritalea sp.]